MHITTRRPLTILIILIGCRGRDATPLVPQADNEARVEADASTAAPTVAGEKLPAELQEMLDEHNRVRAQHCAEPLAWSDTVAHAAKAWVDHLAARGCGLQHSEASYGENLAGGSASTQSPVQVVNLWYREGLGYDFARGGFSMRSGHFTQVVWRGSRRLGCASAPCGDMRLWVCNYDPPGNMQGDFQRNVLPTSCASR